MADPAQYISELDQLLPVAGASAGEGDDEIRAFKRAVQQTLVGSPANHDWSAYSWDRAQPDPFDQPQVLGPRAINSLPKVVDAIAQAIIALNNKLAILDATQGQFAQIPVGLIAEWAGAVVDIPTNWKLCDGTSGTPNLRNRFIVGAGGAYAPGDIGGANPTTGNKVSGAGSAHKHGGKTQGTALAADQIPAHGHAYAHAKFNAYDLEDAEAYPGGGFITTTHVNANNVIEPAWNGAASLTSGQQIGAAAGAGQPHTHDLGVDMDAESAHTHNVDVRPAYYALAYIQFKGVPPPVAPTLVAPVIPPQNLLVGAAVNLNIAARFAGETSYSCGLLPAGIIFDPLTGTFTGNVTTVQVVATQITGINAGGSVSDIFTWTIT